MDHREILLVILNKSGPMNYLLIPQRSSENDRFSSDFKENRNSLILSIRLIVETNFGEEP